MNWKRDGVVLALAALTGFLGSAASNGMRTVSAAEHAGPITVTAESFVVVDATGRKRAEMSVDENGRPVIRLYDSHGKAFWSAGEVRILPLR